MRRQLLAFLISTGAAIGGLFSAPPAQADCRVAWQSDCDGGNCGAVFYGECNGGSCTVMYESECNGGNCTVMYKSECNSGNCAVLYKSRCGAPKSSSGGSSCGLATAQVDPQNPKKFDSTITGGPFAVISEDPVGNTISDVTITCKVQINQSTHGGTGVTRSNTTAGNVGVLQDTVSYLAQPTDSIYLCTKVEWNSTEGHTTAFYDIDHDSSNGLQCEWVNDGDPFPDN